MSKYYMRGKKILDSGGNLFATVEKTREAGRYDICYSNGGFMCSVFNYGSGFGISSRGTENSISVSASRKALTVGFGVRMLPKPIIPLGDVPYGSYSGVFEGESLVITRNTIKVGGRVTAKYNGANTGPLNAALSGYTYRHQYIDILESTAYTDMYIAIYAYLFRIR